MRALEAHEVDLVSGGAPTWWTKQGRTRADPAEDVNGDRPGNATGWCRGYGNMKEGENKHGLEHGACPDDLK